MGPGVTRIDQKEEKYHDPSFLILEPQYWNTSMNVAGRNQESPP